ncbi:MAG: GTPase Era [Candidatus Stygibacter australis]|nr:GTPase Era [Candidatus Stygibacter australis]MDP8321353.1 GTPase Era [Candidatus Stygibacter australis]
MDNKFKSGFVTIIGKPNVGKSTLMNRLLGEKLSIVSPKPQTTRHQIKGILNGEDLQIIFLDTPGFLEPRYELHNRMMDYIKIALKDADLILFITDANHFPTDYDQQMLKLIGNIKIPKLALLNKIDLVEPETIEPLLVELRKEDFDKVIPISLLVEKDIAPFLDTITTYLPYNPPYYGPEELSDLPLRFFAQEIIREQIFLNFRDEIPYSSTVMVENYQDFPNKVEIDANIWLERKSQKIILIGKGGEKIKSLRMNAEREIYKITGKRAKLTLWIKIKPNWRKKKNALKEFGYQ